MIDDVDVWRAAALLVKRHGKSCDVRQSFQTDRSGYGRVPLTEGVQTANGMI